MALHHHCSHHHSSTGHCTHHQHHLKSSNNVFRPGAGHGIWLPALLPAACIAGNLTDASALHHISLPLTLLALQSCIYCFFLAQQQIFSKTPAHAATGNETVSKTTSSSTSRLSTSASSKSAKSPGQTIKQSKPTSVTPASRIREIASTQPGAQRRSSLIGRSADAVTSLWASNARPHNLRLDGSEFSPMSQRVVVLHLITIGMICCFSETGLLAAGVANVVNLSVQGTVSRWLLLHHSSTFSLGEWLMAGQSVGVSVACSLLSLLSPCPREVAYTACQLNTFLQLSVVLSAGLLLLFLALPAPHSSSPLILLPLTLAVGGAGVLWASLMLGEFVPWWLTRQILSGDGNWSVPLSNASGCGGVTGSGYALNGRSEAAWWFGHDGSGSADSGGLKTWWGGGRNSWYANLFGSRETSTGGTSRWWSWLRGGRESWLSYIFGGGFLWGATTRGSEHSAVIVVGWRRPLLLLWWAMCSGAAWGATRWVHRYQHVSVSVVRKLYHLVAVLVFVAGVVSDPPFLKLATVAATIACLIMEVVRVLKVPGFSSLLTNAFAAFLDEKDSQGTLILSHVYLLIGLSLPLWILNIPALNLPPKCHTVYSPSTSSVIDQESVGDLLLQRSQLSETGTVDGIDSFIDVACWCGPRASAMLLLAGVLSVGIGDTFASVGGIRFGKHKWPQSKKSLEGTVCGVVAQVVMVALLVLVGGVVVTGEGAGWWCGVVATMLLCGVVEALTDQVDNLVLPLLMFCGISLTEYVVS